MWRLGFAFHEMASGLLSVFLPLYIVAIDGANALLDIGIMSAVACFWRFQHLSVGDTSAIRLDAKSVIFSSHFYLRR